MMKPIVRFGFLVLVLMLAASPALAACSTVKVSASCSGAVCASGSLWYPGFRDFALSHTFKRTPTGIYLSLGDWESVTKNPALQKTEDVFRTLCEHYRSGGLASVFELNPGNHYRDMDLRMAKGYCWLLSQ